MQSRPAAVGTAPCTLNVDMLSGPLGLHCAASCELLADLTMTAGTVITPNTPNYPPTPPLSPPNPQPPSKLGEIIAGKVALHAFFTLRMPSMTAKSSINIVCHQHGWQHSPKTRYHDTPTVLYSRHQHHSH